jgi:hypothetical protein
MSPVQVETNPEIKGPAPKTFEIPLADHGVGGYGLNIIANPDAWKSRRRELEALTGAIERGYRDGCAHRDRAVAAFVKLFPSKSSDYVRVSWDKVCNMVGNDVGHQDENGWKQTIALYNGLGVLKARVQPSDIIGK